MNGYQLIGRVLPIVLLFGLGYLFRRTSFLSPATAAELKKLVVHVTLPALLLRAFISLDAGREEVLLAVMMFGLCLLLLLAARVLALLFRRRGDIRAYMVSGFEAGMLGYALFLSVYGDAALPVFASVDLGQVLFVFLVLMPLLLARRAASTGFAGSETGNISLAAEVMKNVVRSPVVWAIAGGLVIGGLGRYLNLDTLLPVPVSGFLELTGGLTVPLIALAVGYELRFRREVFGRALLFVLIRTGVLSLVALVLIRFLPVTGDLTDAAFVTMLLLPPPFVVALAASDTETAEVSGILSLSTVVSIPAFALAVFLLAG